MRRDILLPFLAVAFVTTSSIAQIPDTLWTKTFGGEGWDNAHGAQITADGGTIIIGGTDSFGAGGTDFWLIKTDPNGNEVWSRTFGGPVGDHAHSVCQTKDGGFILTGGTESFGAGNSDIWLIKTNSNGGEEWNRTLGGVEFDGASIVIATDDGGFVIAGETSSIGAGGSDAWLIKTDAPGHEEWNHVFGGTANDQAYSICQTSDGGYLIAGGTESFGAGSQDCWLIKTDSAGNEVWSRTFGGSADDYGYDVMEIDGDGFIVTGGTDSYGAGNTDVWLLKVTNTGDAEWTRTFGGEKYDVGINVIRSDDGGYVIVGITESFGAGSGDIWLIATDMDGNDKWTRTVGGTDYEGSNSIHQTSDGGFVISGATRSFGAGSFDLWLLRLGF